jgi:hypothetical protein
MLHIKWSTSCTATKAVHAGPDSNLTISHTDHTWSPLYKLRYKGSTDLLNYLASHLDFFLSRKVYLYFITPNTCSYDTTTFLSYRPVDIITRIVFEADIFTHARNPRSKSVQNANAHRVESSAWHLRSLQANVQHKSSQDTCITSTHEWTRTGRGALPMTTF